jgi:hypothetical protein
VAAVGACFVGFVGVFTVAGAFFGVGFGGVTGGFSTTGSGFG